MSVATPPVAALAALAPPLPVPVVSLPLLPGLHPGAAVIVARDRGGDGGSGVRGAIGRALGHQEHLCAAPPGIVRLHEVAQVLAKPDVDSTRECRRGGYHGNRKSGILGGHA